MIFSGEQLKLKLQLTPSKEAVHAFKIFFHFDDLNRSQPRVEVCNVKITFADDLVADLANTGGQYVYNKRPKGPSRQYYQRGHAIPGQPLPGYVLLVLLCDRGLLFWLVLVAVVVLGFVW